MSEIVLSDKDRAAVMNNINSTGIFVTIGRATPNVMVTHNGLLGKMWGREVFVLPIKSSKYSYQIITQTKSFALNVPARDMRNEIAQCDVISGYRVNKFQTLGLHPKRARAIEAYVLGECGLIVECKVIAAIPPENISAQIDGLFEVGRGHTLFVAEVATSYRLR